MRKLMNLLTIIGLASVLLSCNPEPPNVILIMADDMGAECLSLYGGTSYATPRLAQMAEEGLVVDHCIAQPLCTPSRVKIMTGLSNSRNYEHFGYLNTTWYNMGTLMNEAGYRTCISGKWQLNGLSYKSLIPDWDDPTRPHQMGFDEYCLWQLTHIRAEGERYADPLIEMNGEVLETDQGDYGPDIFCDFILDFIEKNQDEPFFVYYPMVLVHNPFVPTPDSEEWKDLETRGKNDTAYFAHMVTYTDKIVGKIQDKLEEKGLKENTILIFTADNGTNTSIISHTRNRRIRGAKGNTISDGVHVPLLINWPDKIKKAARFHGLIEFSDFFATFADLVDKEVSTDGHSFLPLLRGKPFKERETVQVHYDPLWSANVNKYRNRFIQTVDYKLYQDGSFYDLYSDILEKQPLSGSQLTPEQEKVYPQLERELLRGEPME